jgi:hypothetical protein
VTTNIVYQPVMLSAIGIGARTVTGTAVAETRQAYLGEDQS